MDHLRKKYNVFKSLFKHPKSRNSTPTSISERVLYNPELLECIMIHLPERDLLVNAQQVCRLWHSLITTSPTLQQILGFQPTETTQEGTVNPILASCFSPWFRSFENDAPRNGIERLDFRNLDWNSSPRKREAYRRKDASWRRMLAVQPPVQEISIIHRFHLGGRFRHGPRIMDESLKGNVIIQEGLRMGFLYDLAQESAGNPRLQKGSFEFWIDWRRSAAIIRGEKSDDTKAKIIKLYVDSTMSIERGTETPLETYFRSLAFEALPTTISWKSFHTQYNQPD